MAAAGEQGAFHAVRRHQVGGQDIAQVERLQVLHVERVRQPCRLAEQLVGAEQPVGVQVQERAQRIVLLAVRRLAGQVRPVWRRVDDQPRPVGGGMAQDQGDEGGVQPCANALEEGGPGHGLGRALVEQAEQGAQLAGRKRGGEGIWGHDGRILASK
ncbi:hypothetical protein D3C72_1959600 [compost metagenome]